MAFCNLVAKPTKRDRQTDRQRGQREKKSIVNGQQNIYA